MGKDFDSDIVKTIEKLKACEDVQKALQLVKQQLPEIIEIQKELALIEAPTFHEENKARRYAELLTEAGLEEVKIDEHFNVWGRWPGVGKTGKSVLLEGHLDTVFSFGDVKELKVDDEGRIHCPGICDDTRAIAANLSVLKAFKALGYSPLSRYYFRCDRVRRGIGRHARYEDTPAGS